MAVNQENSSINSYQDNNSKGLQDLLLTLRFLSLDSTQRDEWSHLSFVHLYDWILLTPSVGLIHLTGYPLFMSIVSGLQAQLITTDGFTIACWVHSNTRAD